MADTPPVPANPEPEKPKMLGKMLLYLALIMLVPFTLIKYVFPLIDPPVVAIEELKPENIQWFRVQVLNRQGVDDGPDIGPYYADPLDFALLLSALQNVPEVASNDYPDARGPWLGEYRLVTLDGRKPTIRFYWVRQGAEVRLRFQIGKHKFEGGTAAELIRVARTAQARGRDKR